MDVAIIEQEAATLAARATAIQVVDAPSYEAAAGELLGVTAYLKRVDDLCDGAIEAGHQAHKAALAVKAKLTGPAQAFQRATKMAMATWQQAEQARLDAAARAAEAEQRRLEEDARVAEAAQLEQAGDGETAVAVLATPAFVPPVIAPRAAPKVAGVTTHQVWKAVCSDLLTLVRAIAAGKAPLNLVQANQPAINAQVRLTKGDTNVPGLKAWPEIQTGVRA